MASFPELSLLVLALFSLAGCGTGNSAPSHPGDECVVLLHGLARTSVSMDLLARSLQESGYQVANIDYPSREHPIEELAEIAVGQGIRQCASKGKVHKIHFVTHSLGGILVRSYFAKHDLATLGRVVMLAPPNQGSKAADVMRDVPGFDWLNGPAGYQLGKGEESVPLKLGPPDFDFAVIAGDRTIDPVTSAVLDDPDDGRVSVSDTRLEGMKDFRIVDVSHAFIMQSGEVIRLVKQFLKTDSFAGAFADEGTVRIMMSTTEGDIGIDLYLDKAPVTAGNFLKLVDNGDLDGGSFYRVVNDANDKGRPRIAVIQGGLGDDAGENFATIDHETTEQTGILHTDGVISMARGDVGTASTEFFICIGDQPGLDYGQMRNPDKQGFAAFGKVISGMDVVRKINGLPANAPSESEYTKGQILEQPVRILSVRRAD